MQIRDSVLLDASGLKLTNDGYLVGDAKVARGGNVQQYYGFEIGLEDERKNQVFGVYRDPDVVFDNDSMMSLAGRPVTRGHPKDSVTAANWKDLAKGQVGGVIRRDGEHVVAPMAIMDAEAAKEVADGARCLSAGYTVNIVEDAGTAPDGTPYQYKQAGPLRFNHVAYLPDNNPRAGNTRIGDVDPLRWGASPVQSTADTKGKPMADNLQTVVLGDKAVQVADKDAPIVDAFKVQAAADRAKLVSDHQAAIAAKDEEIGTLKADLKKAQDAALKPGDLDRMVADRQALVKTVNTIDAKIVTDGKSDNELRLAAVAAKLGDEMVKDASEAEIAGMFKAIAKDAKAADPFVDALKGGVKIHGDLRSQAEAARQAHIQSLRDGWKTPAAAEQ